MKTCSLQLAVAMTIALLPRAALAQHEHHQPGAQQASAEMMQCARVQPLVDNIVTGAMARLETARQANSPSEMRAAVDHLETALRDIRAQLEPCTTAAAAAAPHAGYTSGQPFDKQIDPVNGLVVVDPATAPRATYQGQTYYFSSEQSRKAFLANPAKFAKKPKG